MRPDHPDAFTNVALTEIQWEKYNSALPIPRQRARQSAGFAGCHKRDLVSFSYPFPFG
jgi:hypothetical protein